MTLINAEKSWVVSESEDSFIIYLSEPYISRSTLLRVGRVIFVYPKPLPALIQSFVNMLKEMERENE